MKTRFNFSQFTFLLLPTFLSLTLTIQAAQARSQSDSNPNLFNTLETMVGDFVGSIEQVFSNVEQSLEDFWANLTSIPAIAPEDKEQRLSSTLENKPNGSYAIAEDTLEQKKIATTTEMAQESALSTKANAQLEQTARSVTTNVSQSLNLGQASQQTDTSQHILQNLSRQAALSAEREGILIQQNQQAQVDRALSNLLTAQQTKELTENNTTQRRQTASANNQATSSIGLIQLPGSIDPTQGQRTVRQQSGMNPTQAQQLYRAFD